MHPLSLFPSLLSYALLAPFLIRITVGGIAMMLAIDLWKESYKIMSATIALCATAVIVGLFTQLMSPLLAICFIFSFWTKTEKTMERKMFYKILIVATLSLVLSGAGFLAFDLPL